MTEQRLGLEEEERKRADEPVTHKLRLPDKGLAEQLPGNNNRSLPRVNAATLSIAARH